MTLHDASLPSTDIGSCLHCQSLCRYVLQSWPEALQPSAWRNLWVHSNGQRMEIYSRTSEAHALGLIACPIPKMSIIWGSMLWPLYLWPLSGVPSSSHFRLSLRVEEFHFLSRYHIRISIHFWKLCFIFSLLNVPTSSITLPWQMWESRPNSGANPWKCSQLEQSTWNSLSELETAILEFYISCASSW